MKRYDNDTLKILYNDKLSAIKMGDMIKKYDELLGLAAGYAIDISGVSKITGEKNDRE